MLVGLDAFQRRSGLVTRIRKVRLQQKYAFEYGSKMMLQLIKMSMIFQMTS